MVRRFTDQSAIVFGGASGIGAATVERLAQEGCRTWIADLVDDGTPRALGCDARKSADVAKVFRTVDRDAGRVSVVVNCIGLPSDGTATDTSDEAWRQGLEVNLTTAFTIGREALKVMIPHGTGVIVHVASDAGLVAWPGQVAYSAAKGGLIHLVKAQAVDSAPYGIRVNAVCPSFCRTPMVDQWLQTQREETWESLGAMQPLGRIAEPGEVASAIAFLASNEAAYITGVAMPVDGGVSAQ